MLSEFITLNREEIIRRCRAKVATRSIPTPSETEINHGVPLFLDQLVDALRHEGTSSLEIDTSAARHGHDLLLKGFTVSQVVHDYGDVCQTITELAVHTNAPISTEDFRMLNRCLDQAIAGAVTMYARESQQARLDEAKERDNERVGFLVHELRNLINTATVAFEVLKTGQVGLAGSTGAVLDRSLMGLRNLIARALDEVRLTRAVNRTRILVSEFIDDVAAAARLAANARGIAFIVRSPHDELTIEADQQILAAVVGNLLQNAFKFTRPHSTVTLSVGASADRVMMDIQDECGGLPGAGDAKELSPSFAQQGADRTGLGIGLAFSRWGAEANGGRLYARNLPERGCVFTVDLPRSLAPVVARA
jgi:signal transduction histidine kinase